MNDPFKRERVPFEDKSKRKPPSTESVLQTVKRIGGAVELAREPKKEVLQEADLSNEQPSGSDDSNPDGTQE